METAERPAQMPSSQTFWIGAALWGYKDWIGDFFPPKSRSADFLKLYSRRLTTVEGNTTFYSVPDAATVRRWASETPDGFMFCPKLPRDVTHQGMLASQTAGAIAFLDRMQNLGDRLGPLFAQLPPSYGPSQFDDLAAFLQAWPTDTAELAVEVRHPQWFESPHADKLHQLLHDRGIGRVILDTRPIYDCEDDPQVLSERKKPRVPLCTDTPTDFCLVRYISHPNQDFNAPYWDAWVHRIDTWLRAGKRVYFFVHCPQEEHSVTFARHVQGLLEAAGAPVPPLPWNELADPPAQLSLF